MHQNYYDQDQDRKGDMLLWSYAWASSNPWYATLPPDTLISASLSVMIIGIPQYQYQFILSKSSISLLLSRTGNKMPNIWSQYWGHVQFMVITSSEWIICTLWQFLILTQVIYNNFLQITTAYWTLCSCICTNIVPKYMSDLLTKLGYAGT